MNGIELAVLRTLVEQGDRIGYYSALANIGISYGRLALQVAENYGVAGQAANGYFKSYAGSVGRQIDNTELAIIGIELMQADLAYRKSGSQMFSDDYQDYHEAVFLLHGPSKYGWTATVPLEMADVYGGPEAREGLWATMLNSNIGWSGAWSFANVEAGSQLLTATSGGSFDYYSVTANAGARGIFDIDASSFDTIIELVDAQGNLLSRNDDNSADPGSSYYASLIDYKFVEDGTYYLRVMQYGEPADRPPYDGATYTLNVSLSSASVDFLM